MSSVHVECRIGSATFPRCTADSFATDELIITAVDTDDELRVFAPGTWINATVYDSHGNIQFAIFANQTAERRLAS